MIRYKCNTRFKSMLSLRIMSFNVGHSMIFLQSAALACDQLIGKIGNKTQNWIFTNVIFSGYWEANKELFEVINELPNYSPDYSHGMKVLHILQYSGSIKVLRSHVTHVVTIWILYNWSDWFGKSEITEGGRKNVKITGME